MAEKKRGNMRDDEIKDKDDTRRREWRREKKDEGK